MTTRLSIAAVLLLCLGCLLPVQAPAYSVSPSLLLLRPSGDGSSGFVQLANRTVKPVAVELTVHPHHKDADGQGVTGSAEESADDFFIYPAQLVLLPGDEVGVQVRWIGQPALVAERAYTLVTRQVPIPRSGGEETEPAEGVRIDITVLLNYEVRIYVTPPGAKPGIVVESVTENPAAGASAADLPSSDRLEIILVNQGNARASLADSPLVLLPERPVSGQRSFVIPAGSVPALKSPILAGERRRLIVPRPAGLPPGRVRVSLSE